MVNSENLDEKNSNEFSNMDNILVPGGFGSRGIRKNIICKICP